jgi:hypothetical protein
MMKNKLWSVDGNKMLVDTPHKTFNKQTNCIATGNVISNTQVSRYIRAFSDVRTMGPPVVPGYLQKWDLAGFPGLPRFVREAIESCAVDESVILYKFRHFSGNREIVNGWVVTDVEYDLIYCFVTGPTHKSWDIVNECLGYITK